MFTFGFLLDKVSLFPFIIGIIFGLYISKNIFSIETKHVISIYEYIYDFFNTLLNTTTIKDNIFVNDDNISTNTENITTNDKNSKD